MRTKISKVGDFVYYNNPPKDIPKESYFSSSIKDAEKELERGKCYRVKSVLLDYAGIEGNHWYYIEHKNWFSWVCFENDDKYIMKTKYGLK